MTQQTPATAASSSMDFALLERWVHEQVPQGGLRDCRKVVVAVATGAWS